MSKVLVAYFSATGVTAEIAGIAAKAAHADLFEIRAKQPYTARDLDYTKERSRTSLERNEADCRPAILETVKDMGRYGTVFIGFPIWWGREPSIIDTFLEAHNLDGKRIIPFCTSAIAGINSAVSRIRHVAGQNVNVDPGICIETGTKEEVKTWIKSLGLKR